MTTWNGADRRAADHPDCTGCVTDGTTLDEARELAPDALAFHLEGMAEDGVPIPAPSPLQAVMGSLESRDGVAMLVKAPDGASRTVHVDVNLPEDVVREIDERPSALATPGPASSPRQPGGR